MSSHIIFYKLLHTKKIWIAITIYFYITLQKCNKYITDKMFRVLMRSEPLSKKEIDIVSFFLKNGNERVTALELCRELGEPSSRKQTIINRLNGLANIINSAPFKGKDGVRTHQIANHYCLKKRIEVFAFIAHIYLRRMDLCTIFIESDYAKRRIDKNLAIVAMAQMIHGPGMVMVHSLHQKPEVKCSHCGKFQRGYKETVEALYKETCQFCKEPLVIDEVRAFTDWYNAMSVKKFDPKAISWSDGEQDRSDCFSFFAEVMKLSPTALKAGLFSPLRGGKQMPVMDLPGMDDNQVIDIIADKISPNVHSDAKNIAWLLMSSLVSDVYSYPDLFESKEKRQMLKKIFLE